VIAVKVSNARDTAVPPLFGDFTVFGGIYRSVHLLVLDRLSVSPLDDASPGVSLRQTHVDSAAALVSVTAILRNATEGENSGILRCVIRDKGGRRVRGVESHFSLPPGTRAVSLPDIALEHPHLWHGREDPYLYRAEVSVVSRGKVKDRVIQPLGLRFFRVDPGKGFFLNGKPYPLHGVNRHQDREGMGWAIGKKEHGEDFRLITDMGSNAVRLPH
jgi:beta-galactosidase